MSEATRLRLQRIWNDKRDSEAEIKRFRVESAFSSRKCWCAVFQMSPTGRGFIILGGNADEARHSILHNTNLGRGTFREVMAQEGDDA